jgi:hypothetical protein
LTILLIVPLGFGRQSAETYYIEADVWEVTIEPDRPISIGAGQILTIAGS